MPKLRPCDGKALPCGTGAVRTPDEFTRSATPFAAPCTKLVTDPWVETGELPTTDRRVGIGADIGAGVALPETPTG